jgi:uncharacterized oxidoreductase
MGTPYCWAKPSAAGTGYTIFITGGGSGIGRGLAEVLHKLGNQVIITGRRKGRLIEVCNANPGMQWVELNIEDSASISTITNNLITEYPKLEVLINNASEQSVLLADYRCRRARAPTRGSRE